MERLTEQLRWWAAECDRTNFGCQARKLLLEAADRLTYYEDLEEQGRLVVLPCKVGDTVYIPHYEKGVVAVRVQGISISVSGRTILRFGGYPYESAWGDGCGKDWFLTREEAEAALKKE